MAASLSPLGTLIVPSILVCLSASCSSSPERGLKAYHSHEYELAVESWTPIANDGDAMAQFYLGVMHEEGRGTDVDFLAAQEMYMRAATQGVPEAQLNLGRLYAQGKGVEQSYERARMWFERAAQSGLSSAHQNLGIMYLKGFGVDVDIERARAEFEIAAQDDSDTLSKAVLAALHGEGLTAGASKEESAQWLAAAAAAGDVRSQKSLGFDLLEQRDWEGAAHWLGEAARGGDPRAQLVFGWMQQVGCGVPEDPDGAAIWIETAAHAGDTEAMMSAAVAMVTKAQQNYGRGAVQGATWMLTAAETGSAHAQFGMGLLHVRGLGVKRSYAEAIKWFRLAEAQGLEQASERLEAMGELPRRIKTGS